jgi:hypothetical protein
MSENAEISFDLVMEEEMSFVEGAFRLEGADWQVFTFCRHPGDQIEVNVHAIWASGATGVTVRVPKEKKLHRAIVLEILSAALGVRAWREVRGPDSMTLR